jgi:hypothetical protein
MVNTKLVRTTPQRDYTPRDTARSNAYSDVILTEREAVESIQYIESITDRGLARHSMSMQVLARVVPA